MRRSGITSRAKWASFSISQTSCNSAARAAPRSDVQMSVTGVPTHGPGAVVWIGRSWMFLWFVTSVFGNVIR